MVHLHHELLSVLSTWKSVARLPLVLQAAVLASGSCSRSPSGTVVSCGSGSCALVAGACAFVFCVGLVACFGWSWAWNVGAKPLFRLLGRESGFSPGPGGLHLAVQRGSEQHEGHTLAGPPSETSRGHSPGCLPSPPPRRHHPHFLPYLLSLLFPCEKCWLGVGDGNRFV